MVQRWLAAAAALAVAGVLLTPDKAQASDRIVALFPPWPGVAPALVAQDLGYFAEEGLDFVWRFEAERSVVSAAMARGDIDIDMRSIGEYQSSPRSARMPGLIIGTTDVSVGGDGVVVDQSITAATDLKGRTVAFEPNIPARLLLQLELQKAGLTLGDVKVKEIGSADSVAVFQDPSVAAIATYEPYLSQVLNPTMRPGAKLLVSSQDYPGIVLDVVIARNAALAENPEKFRKFLRGFYRAVDLYLKDPQAFAERAAPHFDMAPDAFRIMIESSLRFTAYEEAVEYLGSRDEVGKLPPLFAQVMSLNLNFGSAEARLDPALQIDPSMLTGLFDGKTR